jgi:hypothetical protein
MYVSSSDLPSQGGWDLPSSRQPQDSDSHNCNNDMVIMTETRILGTEQRSAGAGQVLHQYRASGLTPIPHCLVDQLRVAGDSQTHHRRHRCC